jgi:5'-3' exonuclease
MGIRGVWSTFQSQCKPIDPMELPSLRIGLDMFSLVYTHRAHLKELIAFLLSWSQKHTLVCVWDGTAPQDKTDVILQRRSVRESASDNRKMLEKYLEEHGHELGETDIKQVKTAITSLGWQSWHLTGAIRREVQAALPAPIVHKQAKEEADDELLEAAMDRNEIDVILTLDSDMFVMGAPRIWRLMRMRGQWQTQEYCVKDICQGWGISLKNLQDAAFLSGWDRFSSEAEAMPFSVALNRIKHYRSLSVVCEKFGVKPAAENLEKLEELKAQSRARWVAR